MVDICLVQLLPDRGIEGLDHGSELGVNKSILSLENVDEVPSDSQTLTDDLSIVMLQGLADYAENGLVIFLEPRMLLIITLEELFEDRERVENELIRLGLVYYLFELWEEFLDALTSISRKNVSKLGKSMHHRGLHLCILALSKLFDELINSHIN